MILLRRSAEDRLIALIDQYHAIAARGHDQRHRANSANFFQLLDWLHRNDLLAPEDRIVFDNAMRVRNAILAHDEHDRTMRSLRRHVRNLKWMCADLREDLADLEVHEIPDNVRQLRLP